MSDELLVSLDQDKAIVRPHVGDDLDGHRAGAGADFQNAADSRRRRCECAVFATAEAVLAVADESRKCHGQAAAAGQHGARAVVSLAKLPPKNAIIGQPLTHGTILRHGTTAAIVSARPADFARSDLALEVVPQAEADLLFELVERLVLARLAVEVLHAGSHDLARFVAPEPAGLGVDVAAEIDLLAQVGVDGQERRAVQARRARLRELGAELKFPRLGAAVDVEAPAGFGIEPHERLRVVRGAEHERIAHVVDAVVQAARVGDRELVAQVRAEVVDGEFVLPVVDAVGERNANSIVGRFEVADLVERQPHHRGGFDIEFPALRKNMSFVP